MISYVFGGFITQTWEETSSYKADNNYFIFSPVNQKNSPQTFFIKTDCIENAIHCNSSYGPTFDCGHDYIFAITLIPITVATQTSVVITIIQEKIQKNF
jgi:hypothetical protein